MARLRRPEAEHEAPEAEHEAIRARERLDARFLLYAPLGLDDAALLAMAEESGWPVKSDEEVLAARRMQERTCALQRARMEARRAGRPMPDSKDYLGPDYHGL
jgi:hypothetical protein